MTLIGQTIGPYRVEQEIGRGGMATVYLCIQPGEPHTVALKVLHPHMAQDPMIVRRFKLESENGARIHHPNIVAVYGAGYADGYHYLAMEYIGGGTLAEVLKRRKQPLTIDEALPLLRQVADGLDYAHNLGILHRDVKPSNLMLDENGRVLLTDFGVARQLAADHTVVTVAGFAVGTPAYMSPEQARGDLELDRRSDVYSLGVVAYALLTGQLPFDAPSQIVLLRKIIDDLPVMPEVYQSNLPVGVGYVLRKVLAKDPARRYATAGEFAAALDQGRRWKPTPLDLAAAEKALLIQPPSPTIPQSKRESGSSEQSRRSRRAATLIVGALLLATAASVWYFYPQLTAGSLFQLGSILATVPAEAALGAGQNGSPTSPPTWTAAITPTPASATAGAELSPLAAVAPADTSTPAVVSILLTPFTDEELRFSLNVPQGWQRQALKNGLRFVAPDTPVALFVYLLTGDSADQGAQAALETFVNEAPQLFPNLSSLQQLEIESSSPVQAIRFVTHEDSEPNSVIQMVRVGSGKRRFVLGQQMGQAQAGSYGTLLAAVIDSFVVLPDPTPTTTATATATKTATATAARTLTPIETITKTPAPPTASATASAAPAVLPAETVTPAAPSATIPSVATATALPTPSSRPSVIATDTAIATLRPSVTSTRTPVPTSTPTPTATSDMGATSTAEAQRIATLVAEALTALPTMPPTSTPIPVSTPIPTSTPTPSVTLTPNLDMTLTSIAVELTRLAPTPTPDLNMTLTAIAVELTRLAPTPTPDLNMTLTSIAVELTRMASTPAPP